MNCSDISKILNSLSGCELVALASIISVAISNNFSTSDVNTLGSFFSALGQNLSTIADSSDTP